MKILFVLLSFFFCNLCHAQQELSGYWKGIITQEDGGFIPEYALEIYIVQKGDSITGRSYVSVDDIYAEMNLKGTVHSGILLELRDEKILDHEELNGMEWCMKKYQLMLKKEGDVLKMEGHWQGETSFSSCVPGKIYLQKTVPRA